MEEPPYGISREADGSAVRLGLTGELDITVRDELRAAALAAVAEAGPGGVVVDFAGTVFLESEAIGALVDGLTAARNRGVAFMAANAHGLVRRVLEVSGVLDLFDRSPLADDAPG